MNSAWAARFPDLALAIVEAGHEIVAHSTDMNGTIASEMLFIASGRLSVSQSVAPRFSTVIVV